MASRKTTMNLQEDLLKQAMEATGITEKTALVHLGLQELIRKAAARRLIALGGSDRSAKVENRKRIRRGELAVGQLKNRTQILNDLKLLPAVRVVDSRELLNFVEARRLYGKGLSWIDVQLLASALAEGADLMTGDLQLHRSFEKLMRTSS